MEWREVFSVTDAIVTDFGALSIGEPWFSALALSAHPAEPGGERPGVDPPGAGPALGVRPRLLPRATESQNLPGRGARLSVGAATTDSLYASDNGGSASLGLRSRLALARGYTAPGRSAGGVGGALEHVQSQRGPRGRNGPGDRRRQRGRLLRQGRAQRGGELAGSGSMLGVGSAFTLFRKAPVTDYDAGRVRVRMDDLNLEDPAGLSRQVLDRSPPRAGVRGVLARRAERRLGVGGLSGLRAGQRLRAERVLGGPRVSGIKTTGLYYGYYSGTGPAPRRGSRPASGRSRSAPRRPCTITSRSRASMARG